MGTPGSEARNVRPTKQLTLVASGDRSRFFLTFEIKWGLYMGKVCPLWALGDAQGTRTFPVVGGRGLETWTTICGVLRIPPPNFSL